MNNIFRVAAKSASFVLGCTVGFAAAVAASTSTSTETQTRVLIAATSLSDAVVIDCQLPGRLVQLGGSRTYMSPGSLQRLTAIECRTRGGEYTVGDLAGGTFSLRRWLPVAQGGDREAQYYVARIYANGMDGVPPDYSKAAEWYKKAADQKYAPAMQELGYLYEKGLGVREDRLVALNLQRQASGLGEDLDYAWKLTAAKEEAAQQAALLSQQLDDSNAQLQAMRIQLADTDAELQRVAAKNKESRAALLQSQTAVNQLRAKLADAPQGDPERVKELQAQLTKKETEVAAKEKTIGDTQNSMNELQQRFADHQALLEGELTKSQAANSQLTELLATRQEESNNLRARLAQSEQRLIRSQQELTDLRAEYRQGVDDLVAQKAALTQIKAKQGDGGAALLAAKQSELDMQSRRVQDLNEQLDQLRKRQAAAQMSTATASADAGAAQKHAAATEADNAAKSAQIAQLQAQIAEQTTQLNAQRKDMAALSSKSDSERAAVQRDMAAKLTQRGEELDRQQRRIASLEADAAMLRDEVSRYREAKDHDALTAQGDAERAKEALRAAQQKIADQRDQLDQLKTQYASERAELAGDRDKLELALNRSNADREQEVSALKADIQEKESILSARQQHIDALEKQLSDRPVQVASNNLTWRSGGDAKAAVGTAGGAPIPPAGPSNFYALVIGNSNYRYMGSLVTPTNDAKSVADMLEQHYGFKVNLMLDATAAKIMLALHDFTRTLTDSDRLLVYYAGHGGSQDGPPEAAFWLGVDADPDTREGFLSSEMIRGKIKDIQAKHILLVADSCFSSAITHPTTTTIGRAMNQKRFDVQWNRRARMVLTSGMDTPVVDSSGDRTHSLFAKYFIQILRQSNEVMSGEMLSHELSTRMHFEAQRMKVSQTPTYSSLNDANHDFGDFFFVPTATSTVAQLR